MRQIILLLTLLLCTSNGFAAVKTVLVIESYHSGYAWDASYLEGLRQELGSGYKLVTFEMDTKRLPKSLYQKQADLAWQKYEAVNPDLVVLGDDNALKFLGPRFNSTDTPVVFLGVNNNPSDYIIMRKNITGVLERPIFTLGIESITETIRPKPEKVLILFDNGTTSLASVTEIFRGRTRIEIAGTKVDLQMISNYAYWQKSVTEARDRGYGAIIVGLYHTIVGPDGKNIPADEVMSWTSANTPVPTFGFWDFSVGRGKTIGGFVLYGKEQGVTAAGMVKKILNGTSPRDIPPVVGKEGQYVFSRHELERYGLRLPPQIVKKSRFVE